MTTEQNPKDHEPGARLRRQIAFLEERLRHLRADAAETEAVLRSLREALGSSAGVPSSPPDPGPPCEPPSRPAASPVFPASAPVNRGAPAAPEPDRPPSPSAKGIPATPEEKVALFRSFFRGRVDVFPRLWVSSRTGKKGYSPACANEWVRGVCEKPRVKCGACPNRTLLPVTDEVLLDHLRGRHVIGVYPLLEDETCFLLAADFDGSEWKADAAAFLETCRNVGVPASMERSRSENGAHIWIFFSEPVPAAVARKLGSSLLTETMGRRHELSLGSYDRLFPNQDTLPRGGFGNLIALPLQLEARRDGNTEFLDEALEPYRDQWAYLASVKRISRARVEDIVNDAARKGLILGVRHATEEGDEEDSEPWNRSPSRRLPARPILEPMPAVVRAVLAQRLFVEKEGLPSSLLDRIRRLAAFQNPEFYRKQRMRFSTNRTPRIIGCAEILLRHVSLPRGCLPDLEELIQECGSRLAIEDRRVEGTPLHVTFVGRLTPAQEESARALLAADTGICVAPPGAGKTVLGTYLVATRARSTLILVHRRPLLDQWVARLSAFLGIEPERIGRIGAGTRSPNGLLDVAMIQSLLAGGTIDDRVATYGHVIVDECHHVPAVSFERVVSEVKARYLTGLTATPQRRDGHHPILEMQLGPVRHEVSPRSRGAATPFAHRLVIRETQLRLEMPGGGGGDHPSIQDIYRALASDEPRNRAIIDDVISAIEEGRSPLLLTERRDHLEYLAGELRKAVRNVIVLQGGLTPKVRGRIAEEIAAIPPSAERLIVATGKYIGEGFDDARLDTLFLAMPIAWKGTMVQYVGRLQRIHAGKTEVRIVDYVDRQVPMLERMFAKRLRVYRSLGFSEKDSRTRDFRPDAPRACPDVGAL